MQLSAKQETLPRLIVESDASEFFLLGSIGTSKTYAMAYVHLNIALQFPDSIIPVARKNLTEAKIGTFISYLDMADMMGMEEGVDYTTTQSNSDLSMKLSNDSMIIFVPLDKSKDRNFQRAKSINATCAGVDEVDGVQEEGYDTLYSRTGRRNSNGAPAFIVSTCNPNDAWVKQNIYDPWKKGELPPEKMVIEFNIEDSFLYPTGYYDRYKDRPLAWQQRYLYNNWNYLDDDRSLFKMRTLDSIEIRRITKGTRYMGIDVAREGKDRSFISIWEGDTLVELYCYRKEDLDRLAEPHEKSAPPYGHILTREAMRIATEEDIGWQHIGVDGVGLGAGVVDEFRSHGWQVHTFKAGAKAEGDYDMLRSEVADKMAKAMVAQKCFFYTGCSFLTVLKKELTLHQADTTSRIFKVESKEQIKSRLGESPDAADAVMIGFWVKMLEESNTGVHETVSVGKTVSEMYNEFNFN